MKAGDDRRITALAQELARTYPTTDADRDRVVLAVSLDVRGGAGATWSGATSSTSWAPPRRGHGPAASPARPPSGSATSWTSSLPPGLGRAAETAERSEEWLAELAGEGVPFTLRVG